MEIIIGKYAGFCGGVKLAVQKTEEAVLENENIYCLGDVVHNKQVVENLQKKGLKIVYDIKRSSKWFKNDNKIAWRKQENL